MKYLLLLVNYIPGYFATHANESTLKRTLPLTGTKLAMNRALIETCSNNPASNDALCGRNFIFRNLCDTDNDTD